MDELLQESFAKETIKFSKRGGPRPGAGRDPLPPGEAKQQLKVGIPKKMIDLVGWSECQSVALQAIEMAYQLKRMELNSKPRSGTSRK